MISKNRFFCNRLALGAIALCLCLSTLELQAAQLKVEARLIWATNLEKVADPKCKPVDSATAAKFKDFSWKHYYEVKRTTAIIPSRGTNQLALSKKCTIEIKELEGPKVEVLLIGEGKPLNRTTYHLSKGESFCMAGPSKDGSAWFIIITDLEEK